MGTQLWVRIFVTYCRGPPKRLLLRLGTPQSWFPLAVQKPTKQGPRLVGVDPALPVSAWSSQDGREPEI